jgi:hypothetical protein
LLALLLLHKLEHKELSCANSSAADLSMSYSGPRRPLMRSITSSYLAVLYVSRSDCIHKDPKAGPVAAEQLLDHSLGTSLLLTGTLACAV